MEDENLRRMWCHCAWLRSHTQATRAKGAEHQGFSLLPDWTPVTSSCHHAFSQAVMACILALWSMINPTFLRCVCGSSEESGGHIRLHIKSRFVNPETSAHRKPSSNHNNEQIHHPWSCFGLSWIPPCLLSPGKLPLLAFASSRSLSPLILISPDLLGRAELC